MKSRKIVKSGEELKKLTDFLFECRSLKHLPRASLQYLKSPIKENVAEHSFYTMIIGWILAGLEKANEEKIIKMALIHDLAEVRGGDRNLINKFYSQPLDEAKIIEGISKDYDLKDFDLLKFFKEFFQENSLEAKIVKDADVIAGMLLEKECVDLGNEKAKKWLIISFQRLKTKSGKAIGKRLIKVDSDKWWMDLVKKYILKTKFL